MQTEEACCLAKNGQKRVPQIYKRCYTTALLASHCYDYVAIGPGGSGLVRLKPSHAKYVTTVYTINFTLMNIFMCRLPSLKAKQDSTLGKVSKVVTCT